MHDDSLRFDVPPGEETSLFVCDMRPGFTADGVNCALPPGRYRVQLDPLTDQSPGRGFRLVLEGAEPDAIAHPTLDLIYQHHGDQWAWALIITVVVFVPIVEEVIYRGFLQSGPATFEATPLPGLDTGLATEAIDIAATRLGSYRGDEIAGIGGSRATNEEAYAFSKFLRTVVVTPHLDAQLGDGLDAAFAAAVAPRATIDDLTTPALLVERRDFEHNVAFASNTHLDRRLGWRAVHPFVHPFPPNSSWSLGRDSGHYISR